MEIRECNVEDIGLGVDGMNFYRDKKVSNKVVNKFAEIAKERKHLVKISNSYFSSNNISCPWRFVLFSLIEYVTLDGCFTKICGHHFMLVNHFRHGLRIDFPFYLCQSLGSTNLTLSNDLEGDHAFHEGLMVLIINLLKAKKVDKPRVSIKDLDYDTEGRDLDEVSNKDLEDDEEE